MNSLDRFYAEEEAPTVKRTNHTARTMALACQVTALAERALEVLWAVNDDAQIAGAIEALSQIRGVAGRVLR